MAGNHPSRKPVGTVAERCLLRAWGGVGARPPGTVAAREECKSPEVEMAEEDLNL